MGGKINETLNKWEKIKKSSRFHNFLLFLLFIVIASLFWLIMVMNDSVEDTITLRLNIYNKPDSLTYINLPPEKINVTVRDKGTQLMRNGLGRTGTLDINFREYADNGYFRLSNTQLYGIVKNKFGNSSQILSVSVDSMRLEYTSLPGKRVPIDINVEAAASLGNVIGGRLIPSQKFVTVYSSNPRLLDTITRVFTEKSVYSNLSETKSFLIALCPVKGARIEPDGISVRIPVEALVSKTIIVPVSAVGVPDGVNMLLFPASVELDCYLPMSKFNNGVQGFKIEADYNAAASAKGDKLPLKVVSTPGFVQKARLKTDSVEFTIVKNN